MLTTRCAVVIVAFAVELRRLVRKISRAIRHHRDQLRRFAAGFARTRLAGFLQALHPFLVGDRAHAFSTRLTEIESADGGDRLHAQLCRGVAEGIAAARADSERADSLGINLRMLDEEVDGAT